MCVKPSVTNKKNQGGQNPNRFKIIFDQLMIVVVIMNQVQLFLTKRLIWLQRKERHVVWEL